MSYDVIIVGAGAGGGVTAGVLAEAGKHVLLLEKGQRLTFVDERRDHLRNHRLSLYGHNTGPELDGNPRVFVNSKGQSETLRPHEGGYQNNASCVGGGTLVYGAQAWRFMPQDFRMASLYGVPEGSSLADWPITYDELAPYYERAEWEVGVCGDGSASKYQGERKRDYPMPPVPDTPQRRILKRGAEVLGWNTNPVPLLINSTEYLGRSGCVQCGYCVGFQCPSDSKNGSQNTMLPRAMATGNCELVTRAVCERLVTDSQGSITGVSYLVESEGGSLERRTVTAKTVVLACAAIETARLLLNSTSDIHPQGIGNEHDQVGRSLQGHYYPGAFGVFDEPTYDGYGPGVSIATCQFNHGNPGIIGGGMLADEFIKLPIITWRNALPPELLRWGQENKDWMRQNFARTMQVMGPVHEIPNPEGRVTIDASVKDKYGLPVARLSGTTHPETVRTSEYMRERAIEWLKASGAVKIWSYPSGLGLSGGQHQAGTCRMGDDPRTSVTDRWGRVHNHDNLFLADGSVHVTNGGFNPVLTILALAFRTSEYVAKHLS